MGLATATVTDLVAMKLLANSDRWADPTVFSRDIIDLAMIQPNRQVLTQAMGMEQPRAMLVHRLRRLAMSLETVSPCQ